MERLNRNERAYFLLSPLSIGRTVVDFTRSMAKRELTFFSGNRRDQTLVEGVVGRHVGHDDAQHVVDVAGHPVEFEHLRHFR